MKPGCYIDGSQMSSLDFIVAIIDFAVSLGFEIDHQAYRDDLEYLPVADNDDRLDILDALDETATEALDYLNEMAPEGTGWMINEQGLHLEEEEADA